MSTPAPNIREKILSLDKLGALSAKLRSEGKKVALAHGTFDLMHVGHVRHLEHARAFGDVLICTITADEFVRKGPMRPVFNQNLRAEMLANSEYVDYVGISVSESALDVIAKIQPNFYIKGSDYKRDNEDVTGNIARERAEVEQHGGRLAFTDDIVFSSSQLINQSIDLNDEETRDFLLRLKSENAQERLPGLIEKASNLKVLMVGDTIIDEYRYVQPLGKSQKENMIATHYQGQETFYGGVLAAANIVADFVCEVHIVTTIGDDNQEHQISEHLHAGVSCDFVPLSTRPTTRKTRYVDPTYFRKLFEVYEMDDTPLNEEERASVDGLIESCVKNYDVVIVCDFGHGMVDTSTRRILMDSAKFLAVNAQTNSANIGFNLITRYGKSDYICIDAPEARLAAGQKFAGLEDIVEKHLRADMDAGMITVTHGKHGCVVFDDANGVKRAPALTDKVVDTIGAGDAFFVVSALLRAVGGHLDEVAFVGNIAGALKVGILGHRSAVEKAAVLKSIVAMLK